MTQSFGPEDPGHSAHTETTDNIAIEHLPSSVLFNLIGQEFDRWSKQEPAAQSRFFAPTSYNSYAMPPASSAPHIQTEPRETSSASAHNPTWEEILAAFESVAQ